jgi:phosphatidylserine/phosphatidylglycerophosphate/cardiolipin synthase-like enzyme
MDARGTSGRILQPGRNCWRREHANRAAFIVDGEAYFTAIAEAFAQAKRSIVLVGWDIDCRIALRRGDRDASSLGALLASCVAARPELHAWVLGWDFSPIYWLERDPLLRLRFALGTSGRVHFAYDDQAPPRGSQHEKLVVIDDALGFCGGLDLCDVRWDTPEHRVDDPRRVDVGGEGYRPHHDVQIAVDGAAAAALGEIVRDRWHRATGKVIPEDGHDDELRPWPQSLRVDVRDVDVGIARTRPGHGDAPPVREVEQLWLDSIRAAQRSIVVENAYFTSKTVASALDRRLGESEVEAVLVTPQEGSG